MTPTLGTERLGWYIFPFVYDPPKFGGLTKEGFTRILNQNGIPTDDCYPPLHSLDCFKFTKLKKGIDYSHANWGSKKINIENFPVVSDIYSRSIQFPQELLLASKDQLNSVIELIDSLRK